MTSAHAFDIFQTLCRRRTHVIDIQCQDGQSLVLELVLLLVQGGEFTYAGLTPGCPEDKQVACLILFQDGLLSIHVRVGDGRQMQGSMRDDSFEVFLCQLGCLAGIQVKSQSPGAVVIYAIASLAQEDAILVRCGLIDILAAIRPSHADGLCFTGCPKPEVKCLCGLCQIPFTGPEGAYLPCPVRSG